MIKFLKFYISSKSSRKSKSSFIKFTTNSNCNSNKNTSHNNSSLTEQSFKPGMQKAADSSDEDSFEEKMRKAEQELKNMKILLDNPKLKKKLLKSRKDKIYDSA